MANPKRREGKISSDNGAIPQTGKEGAKTEKPTESRKLQWLIAFFTVFIALGTAFLLFSSFIVEETEPTPVTSHLIEFYGRECPHCARMAPVVSSVESELNVSFSKLEVWHNSGNNRIFEGYMNAIKPACGGNLGVPAFYNMRNGKALCGEVPKEELKSLAKD